MALKILTLFDFFGSDSVGGSGKVFDEVSKELVGRGHSIDAICRWGESPPDESSGISFYTYSNIPGGQFAKLRHYRKSIRKILEKRLESRKYDLLIIHSSSAALGTKKILRQINIPIIYYFHSPWHLEYEIIKDQQNPDQGALRRSRTALFSALRKHLEKNCLDQVNGIVTLSEFMQQQLQEHHPDLKPVPHEIIQGGANLDKFFPVHTPEKKDELRKKLQLPLGDFTIITSRRLVPRTGVDLLIDAFAIAKKQTDKPIQLALTGRGFWGEKLRNLVHSLDLEDCVTFTGYVPEDKLAEYYRASDLFVMPTRHLEGFGLSTVEAMASGIPVIGTNIGGTPEILQKVSLDLILKDMTAETMAEKIIEIVNRDDLADLEKQTLQTCLENFTWEKHTDQLLDFYEKIK